MALPGSEIEFAVKMLALAHKQRWHECLVDLFRRKHRVLVLGTSGVGKTNFLNSLNELLPAAIDHLNRTQFPKDYPYRIDGHPFVFVDTPGQAGHQPARIQELQNALKEGIDGIINVVAYGYHEGPSGTKDVFEENGAVKETYLMERRAAEIGSLAEWTALLGSREVTKWLITLVSKADLWWDQRSMVVDHYREGSYFAALGPATSLNHAVLEYSSVRHRFYGKGLLSGTFDDAERLRLREHLLRQLLSAIEG
jgi:energy-coupling factor transporter ATP-binding protein EcfA2